LMCSYMPRLPMDVYSMCTFAVFVESFAA